MKILKNNEGAFNVGDKVTMKDDDKSIKNAKINNIELFRLYKEEGTITDISEDYDEIEVNTKDDIIYTSSDEIKLVKQSDTVITRAEIETSQGDRILSFGKTNNKAVLNCGEEILLKDLIELGKLAEQFYVAPKAKKKATKKKK